MIPNLISVVIPTFRPNNDFIHQIFKLISPKNWSIELIFVVDNPNENTSKLENLVEFHKDNFKDIKIIKNGFNLGASESRNKGIERAEGDFIYFLDDDCIIQPEVIENYVEAYYNYPDYPGYVGLTNAEKPETSFQDAVELSDMMHFWTIAERKEEVYWGITANLFIKRSAIGEIRFPVNYPKKGGGEDIYFCLKVIDRYNSKHTDSNKWVGKKLLKSVPEAEIIHPFWEESRNAYKRFYRWGFGDVYLHQDFPDLCFRQFTNLVEILFITTMLNLILGVLGIFHIVSWNFFEFFLLQATSIIFLSVWDILCEANKFKKQKREFNLVSLLKAVFIRQLNDLGRFSHQFPRFWEFTRRWDYFGAGESIKYERTIALTKFIGFVILLILLGLFIYVM